MPTIYMWSTGPATVAQPSFNPHLRTTSETEVLESALPVSPRAQLLGIDATVSAARVKAMLRQGGETHAGGLQLTLNGVEYTKALAGPVSLGETEGDSFQRTMIPVAASHVHYQEHQLADSNVAVKLYWAMTEYGTGTSFRVPIFSGVTQYAKSQRQGRITWLQCESDFAFLDQKPYHDTIVCSGLPYNCVIMDVGNRCAATAASGGTVTIADGMVAFDGTTIGQPPGGGSGGGGGGPNTGGGIVYVPVAAQTITLASQSGLTLNNAQNLGWKSIWVGYGGIVRASDGPPPINGVGLYMWEHRFVGMPVTLGDLVSIRQIYPSADKRKISDIIRFIGDESGATTSTWRFPTVNDDVLTSTMQFSGKASEHIKALARLACWLVTEPGDGTVVFVPDRIEQTAPVMWPYTANRSIEVDQETPELTTIPGGGLVVEGLNVQNMGQELTKETSVTERKLPKSRKRSTGAVPGNLGGLYATLSDRGSDEELVTVFRVETTTYKSGNSIVLKLDEEFALDNPLDVMGASQVDRDALTDMGSPEAGVSPTFDEPRLIPKRRIRWEPYYKGRLLLGWTKTTEVMDNPISHSGHLVNATVGYGWKYREERWRTFSVEFVKIKPTVWGFIAEQTHQIYQTGNPNVNHESGKGPPSWAFTAGHGRMHGDEEDLMLMLEEATAFTREDWEWYRVERNKHAFRKKSGASAHASLSLAPGFTSMGHQAGEIADAETEKSRLRGQPPAVETLADRVERTRVGHKLISPTLLAAYGDRSPEPIRPPHCQSGEQSERIALNEWGNRTGHNWAFTAPFNPGLRRGHTISWSDRTRSGRTLDVRGKVTWWRATLPHHIGKGRPSFQFGTRFDRYDLSAMLAART